MLDSSANDMFEQGNYRRRRTRRQRHCLKANELLGENIKHTPASNFYEINDNSPTRSAHSEVDVTTLNYSDRITEIHRQYLATIAPFNILFRNSATNLNQYTTATADAALKQINTPLQHHTNSNEAVGVVRDYDAFDVTGGTFSNSNSSIDSTRLINLNSPSAFTVPSCTSSATTMDATITQAHSPGNCGGSPKTPTLFTIENIIKKD
ncbi:fork head domain-containing protein FD2-like [Teleopsis dalmanni]|nr:fork head domain-containing protein FD2-like [Teleopsis dalmanni]